MAVQLVDCRQSSDSLAQSLGQQHHQCHDECKAVENNPETGPGQRHFHIVINHQAALDYDGKGDGQCQRPAGVSGLGEQGTE
ncbi:MAG: hypothetical protein HYZ31_11170 [Gammaproteobacteria bacterium]|nr:hypothetical protein [Gammaproteobacteria bacterium]